MAFGSVTLPELSVQSIMSFRPFFIVISGLVANCYHTMSDQAEETTQRHKGTTAGLDHKELQFLSVKNYLYSILYWLTSLMNTIHN